MATRKPAAKKAAKAPVKAKAKAKEMFFVLTSECGELNQLELSEEYGPNMFYMQADAESFVQQFAEDYGHKMAFVVKVVSTFKKPDSPLEKFEGYDP